MKNDRKSYSSLAGLFITQQGGGGRNVLFDADPRLTINRHLPTAFVAV